MVAALLRCCCHWAIVGVVFACGFTCVCIYFWDCGFAGVVLTVWCSGCLDLARGWVFVFAWLLYSLVGCVNSVG